MFAFVLTFQHFIKTSDFQNIITEMTYLALTECEIDTLGSFNPTSYNILLVNACIVLFRDTISLVFSFSFLNDPIMLFYFFLISVSIRCVCLGTKTIYKVTNLKVHSKRRYTHIYLFQELKQTDCLDYSVAFQGL